jgi:hypothetical protein
MSTTTAAMNRIAHRPRPRSSGCPNGRFRYRASRRTLTVTLDLGWRVDDRGSVLDRNEACEDDGRRGTGETLADPFVNLKQACYTISCDDRVDLPVAIGIICRRALDAMVYEVTIGEDPRCATRRADA